LTSTGSSRTPWATTACCCTYDIASLAGGRLTVESRRERAAQTLVDREGTPEEVASVISWLLGPDGGWVTGQVLSPNGGVVLGR